MEPATTFADLLDPLKEPRTSQFTRLSALSDAERDALAEALPRAPTERRLHLAQELIDLGESDATLDFNAAFMLLLRDADPRVRRLAIEGLWEYEDRSLIEPLADLLQHDPDPEVRAVAALALGRFVVLNEFDALRPRDGERTLDALRTAIADQDQPPEVRSRAVEAVGASSEPWVEQLIWDAYDDDERTMQVGALHAMGRNADSVWLPTLYHEMESEDPERRYEAAGAAGQIGDEDAVPYLADLIGDEDAEVQEAAISALGQIGGDLAIETLREHLQDRDPRVNDAVRAAIAEAQAEQGLVGVEQLPAILRANNGDDEDDDDE